MPYFSSLVSKNNSILGVLNVSNPIIIYVKIIKNIDIIFIVSVIVCSIFLIDEIYNLILPSLFGFPKATEIYKGLGLKYIYFKY